MTSDGVIGSPCRQPTEYTHPAMTAHWELEVLPFNFILSEEADMYPVNMTALYRSESDFDTVLVTQQWRK